MIENRPGEFPEICLAVIRPVPGIQPESRPETMNQRFFGVQISGKSAQIYETPPFSRSDTFSMPPSYKHTLTTGVIDEAVSRRW